MLANLGLHRYIGSNHTQPIPTIIAGVCAIGLTTGIPLLNQPMAYASTVGTGMLKIDGDRPHKSSQYSPIQPLRDYQAPDGLGLPMRREPGGTR